MPNEARIADLESKLGARTQDGKPLKGYAQNVAAVQAELARLRSQPAPVPDSQESATGVSP